MSTGRIKADVVWPAAELINSKWQMKMLRHAYTLSGLLLRRNLSYLHQLLRLFPLTVMLVMFQPPVSVQ